MMQPAYPTCQNHGLGGNPTHDSLSLVNCDQGHISSFKGKQLIVILFWRHAVDCLRGRSHGGELLWRGLSCERSGWVEKVREIEKANDSEAVQFTFFILACRYETCPWKNWRDREDERFGSCSIHLFLIFSVALYTCPRFRFLTQAKAWKSWSMAFIWFRNFIPKFRLEGSSPSASLRRISLVLRTRMCRLWKDLVIVNH